MNKLQQQSLTTQDMPYIADLIEKGNARTQAMIAEIKNNAHTDTRPLPLSFGGMSPSREYYNLFVIGDEQFATGSFTVAKDTALVTYIEPEVKKKFFRIRSSSVVRQILTLPSLFMSENRDFKESRPGQKAILGRVTDIEIKTNDIKISFELEIQLFQQVITDISQSLGISGNPGLSELNNTHWTIKQIDLLQVLADAGIIAIPQI